MLKNKAFRFYPNFTYYLFKITVIEIMLVFNIKKDLYYLMRRIIIWENL